MLSKRSISKKNNFRFNLFLALVFILSLFLTCLPSYPARAENFADPAFQSLWEKTDKAVAEQRVSRPWLWGDAPFGTKQEWYDEASGPRLVQYFDKSRMELTNPFADKTSPYYVTNGLLTKELISGQMQVGDNRFLDGVPADIPVAGDGDNNPACPTYATFGKAGLVTLSGSEARAPDLTGQSVLASLNRNGQVGTLQTAPSPVTFAYYNADLGHNLPDVFWNWLNRLQMDWVYVMGYPISEAYWSKVRVGGEDKEVLMQLFERRVLTYTPGNDPVWQVEMGNIGRHYYQWRYEAGDVRVLDYLTYKSEVDRSVYVTGVFQNETNSEQRIKLTATLQDENGQSVAESDVMLDALSVVPAKGKSPFRLRIKNAPSQWNKLQITSEFLPFLKAYKSNFNYNLQPAGVTLDKTLYGLPRLTGRLTNLGQNTSRYSQVLAIAYDDQGRVLDVESGYTSPQRIAPGESAPFEIVFIRAKNFTRYEVFTEGTL